MHAAKPDRNAAEGSADPPNGCASPAFIRWDAPVETEISHRIFLNALPVAAALLRCEEGGVAPITTNAMFATLARSMAEDVGTLVRQAELHSAIDAFVRRPDPVHQFGWHVGGAVGGRHFLVRLAKVRNGATSDWGNGLLLTLLDRTSEVETERSLRAEMLHDSLTGLPNRAAFNEAVEAVLAGEEHASHAVLVVDLTRFSRVNECMGSLAGDELIITVARRLVSGVRAGDTLARIGGDEFAILLRLEDGPGDALHAAKRIHAALATPFRLSDLEIRIDSAIGCALLGDRANSSEDVVRNAQFALKRAKLSGRVEVYQPGEASEARRRFSLETELRRAIEAEQLHLAFQPLIDLQSNKVHGFEALARWNHPERGPISPAEFIPVAEESGLIVPLGRWAIDAVLRTLAEWDATAGRELPIQMGVNLSAIQLVRDDVARVVADMLATQGVGGSRLTVELTESAIIREPERATRVLGALKELNAKIAMDDFGTGYSSLAYLQRLPIDVLKIDRNFVTGMLGDRDALGIVRAVLSLASALGMETTAEGVETVEVAQTLAALGCLWGQGYYFARPLPRDEALAYCLARSA